MVFLSSVLSGSAAWKRSCASKHKQKTERKRKKKKILMRFSAVKAAMKRHKKAKTFQTGGKKRWISAAELWGSGLCRLSLLVFQDAWCCWFHRPNSFSFFILCCLLAASQPGKQKKKFSSFFKSLVIELDKDLYGPDNHLVEVSSHHAALSCCFFIDIPSITTLLYSICQNKWWISGFPCLLITA